MSNDIAIKVENVSKTFKLPHERTTSIKGAVVNFYKRKKSYEIQQALKDVSLEIKKGEFLGIVGRNGSGKSTLLKLIAGIYTPTKGDIRVNGKLTPFIELGVGFNPELTGRENVFLNGALLGFSRKEMTALYDEIVIFAELEKFMDQKLKNYSSGMQVRLAFSIAIQAKSDILILDEVLAVGDEAFQKKCIKVFDDYKKNKQTVVLVTHDMETVRRYCNRAVLLNAGRIIEQGSPPKVANHYSQLNQVTTAEATSKKPVNTSDLQATIVRIASASGTGYSYGDHLKIRLSWPPDKKVDTVGVALYSSLGERVYATNTTIDKFPVRGTNHITYDVELQLGAGNYFVTAGTFIGAGNQIVDFISEGPEFEVTQENTIGGEGLVRLPHTWERGDA